MLYGPDGFPFPDNHSNFRVHQALSDLLSEWLVSPPHPPKDGTGWYAAHLEWEKQVAAAGKQFVSHALNTLLKRDSEPVLHVSVAINERLEWLVAENNRRAQELTETFLDPGPLYPYLVALRHLARSLLLTPFLYDDVHLPQLLAHLLAMNGPGERKGSSSVLGNWLPVIKLTGCLKSYVERIRLHVELQHTLENLRFVAIRRMRSVSDSATAAHLELVALLGRLLGDTEPGILRGGEAWADRARADLASDDIAKRERWQALLIHAAKSDASQPNKKWLTQATMLVDAIGRLEFQARIAAWFEVINRDTYTSLLELNGAELKGLIWCCSLLGTDAACALLGDAAVATYRKIPSIGARCVKAGNACMHVLCRMLSDVPLDVYARLKIRIKYQYPQDLLDRALVASAERLGLSQSEIAEIAVPTCGLGEHGSAREDLGGYIAEVQLRGANQAKVVWYDPHGKIIKSPPADVTKDHSEAVSALNRTADDYPKVYAVQRARLETLLRTQPVWDFDLWRQRYIEHPLMRTLAARLIWRFELGDLSTLGMFDAGGYVNAAGDKLDWISSDTRVSLWHPLGAPEEVILAWRRRLEDHQIVQPIKQAYREVYVLTQTERQDKRHSRRFAAHILKQHAFHALCEQRGWQYNYQGEWDSQNWPTLRLPEHE